MVPKTNKCLEDIDQFIKKNHFDECGIIYCLSKMDCEKVTETLRVGRLFSFLVSLIRSVMRVLCFNLEVHIICRSLAIKQPSTMVVWILVNVRLYRKNGAKMKSI